MEKVIKKQTFEVAENESIAYWADLSVAERFQQAFEWNNKVWGFILKETPSGIDKRVGGKRLKSTADEDDF